ncbi:hypothetical protein [Vibrio fluvialis]|uniref:hypothetical protein n=1 Tax=Vibrio fluvialis TaxID=676 RepID=UPI00215B927A|nr:hypothetical protein [Vibrio fluvialis]
MSSPAVKQVSTSPRGAQNPISIVFARYVESATHRGKAPQSLSEYGLQIDRLIEVIGDIDVTEVTRGHISTLRDTLLQLPKSKAAEIRGKSIEEQIELAKAKQLDRISPSTVDNCLRKTSSVFGYAFELGLIDVNPHKGVSKAATQKRTEFEAGKGYTETEIALLFKNDLL